MTGLALCVFSVPAVRQAVAASGAANRFVDLSGAVRLVADSDSHRGHAPPGNSWSNAASG